jgi:hypothetical protein
MAETVELALRRNEAFTKDYTAGRLYIGEEPWLYTLEDEVREVEGQPVGQWKKKAITAIPRGRYRVILSKSPRFGRVLPEVLNVPGFTGIRMHRLNTASQSEGCIGIGKKDGNDQDAWLGNSAVAEGELIAKLNEWINCGQQVWLTVS